MMTIYTFNLLVDLDNRVDTHKPLEQRCSGTRWQRSLSLPLGPSEKELAYYSHWGTGMRTAFAHLLLRINGHGPSKRQWGPCKWIFSGARLDVVEKRKSIRTNLQMETP